MSQFIGEQGYLDLLQYVLDNGHKRIDRTGTGTLSVFAPPSLRFHLTDGIPLYTTKKMPWKAVIKELLWFLRGDTDAKILQRDSVRIWDGNTSRQFLDKKGLSYSEGILGPGYGWQWRFFGAQYDEKYADTSKMSDEERKQLTTEGFDQIAYVEKLLKADPFSRKIFMSAWNANDLHEMALEPCHVSVQFYAEKDDASRMHLSAHVYIRSNDLFLGNPFNVFSYAVLLRLMAERTGMDAKDLIFSFGDAHIYCNHIEQVKEQLKRTPKKLPTLKMSDNVHSPWKDITIADFQLEDYMSDPAIIGQMSV